MSQTVRNIRGSDFLMNGRWRMFMESYVVLNMTTRKTLTYMNRSYHFGGLPVRLDEVKGPGLFIFDNDVWFNTTMWVRL